MNKPVTIYPIRVPGALKERMIDFLLEQFLQATITRASRYVYDGSPEIRKQVAWVSECSFMRDDQIALQHTFTFEINAPMLASYVRAMGGDPSAPPTSKASEPTPKKRWWWPW
jgi:hypothetical protein